MKIITLLENETENEELKNAHGLSLYIEFKDHHILFDIGPGNQYIKNADKLGIDLQAIDTVIISHGHFDHGRGLSKFLSLNKTAQIYISEFAFSKKFKIVKGLYLPIGIKKPSDESRIHYVTEDIEIDKGFKLYAKIPEVDLVISDNSLLIKEGKNYIPDSFNHEIYMVLSEYRKKVLFSGCSHKGIENIVDTIQERDQIVFTDVIGGFHLSHYDSADLRQTMYLEQLGAKFVANDKVNYYTGHCTGDLAFLELKRHMHDALIRIKTGSEFEI